MLTHSQHLPRQPSTDRSVMGNRLREWIDSMLPWYDPALERRRDRHTEAIRRRSIANRIRAERAERVIAEYRVADKVSRAAVGALIDEVRRDDS